MENKEKTVEDYKAIHTQLIKYCELMIVKQEKAMKNCYDAYADVKRKAYKDILFKLTKND